MPAGCRVWAGDCLAPLHVGRETRGGGYGTGDVCGPGVPKGTWEAAGRLSQDSESELPACTNVRVLQPVLDAVGGDEFREGWRHTCLLSLPRGLPPVLAHAVLC